VKKPTLVPVIIRNPHLSATQIEALFFEFL
jgi:hypothetical protein